MAKSRRMQEFKQRLKENSSGSSAVSKDVQQRVKENRFAASAAAKDVQQTTQTGHAKYIGDFTDNKTGNGKKIFTNGYNYEGYFVNGQLHGIGKITYPAGSIYEGETVNGYPNGKGKKILSGGVVQEGDFVDGWLHGNGRITYTDGNIYEGECEKGLPHGKGKKTFADGYVGHEGDFVKGQYEGYIYSQKGMKGLLYAKIVEDSDSPAMNATINLDGSINEKAYSTRKLTRKQIWYNTIGLTKTTISVLAKSETQALKNEDIMQLFK